MDRFMVGSFIILRASLQTFYCASLFFKLTKEDLLILSESPFYAVTMLTPIFVQYR